MALMAFPLQSNFEGYDDYGNPVFDRAVDSVFYRGFWQKYWTNGIFPFPADNFKVCAAGGMDISLKLGEAHIQGLTCMPDEEVSRKITIEEAETSRDRTDRVVLRADFENNRMVSVEVIKNWTAASSLTRNTAMWELALADIFVKRGTAVIQDINITDLRLDTECCGIVTEPLQRANTEVFFQQIQLEMERVKAEWNVQQNSQATGWQEQMGEQQSLWEGHEKYWQNQTKEQQALWLSQKENQQRVFGEMIIAQGNEWQSQTDGQQEDFDLRQNEIQGWYDEVRNDIAKLQSFDFDNTGALKGATRSTVFNADGSVKETITNTISGKKIAERLTVFNTNGSITISLKVYGDNGVTILKENSATTYFRANGSIEEEVI